MTRDDIISLLGDDWTRMLDCIDAALNTRVGLLASTDSAILASSGKMLRPMLSLLCARICGKVTEAGVRYAAATEILHNATLIHDDVTDGSELRRGRPTVASCLGAGAAVLVGDFWLAKSVSLISGYNDSRVFGLFSRALSDLAEGELLQLEKAGSADMDEDDYFRIIRCKTTSLFVAACLSGAISAGAAQEVLDAVEKYADSLGCAFQIRDDMLDFCPSPQTGKPTGQDLQEGKITLPLLLAMKGDPAEADIRRSMASGNPGPEETGRIRDFVIRNGGIERCSAVLEEYVRLAEEALAALPESPEKEALLAIARFNSVRAK